MNISWEQHLSSRDGPAVEGMWDDTPWGFYGYDQVLPAALPIRTSMCVPVCSLNPRNPQVMLTLNIGRGGWETPGGHLEVLERTPQAAIRETLEETGLHIENGLIPYGYIEARNAPDTAYPPRAYMQFFGAYTPGYPGPITDPEVDGAGIFAFDALRIMAERGAIQATELHLVGLGIRAVFKQLGLSDQHIRIP